MKHFNKKEPSIPLVMESFYTYTWNELYFTVLHSKKYSILLVSVKLVLYSSLFGTHYCVWSWTFDLKSNLFCQSKALCPSESWELIMWTDTTLRLNYRRFKHNRSRPAETPNLQSQGWMRAQRKQWKIWSRIRRFAHLRMSKKFHRLSLSFCLLKDDLIYKMIPHIHIHYNISMSIIFW